MKSTGKRYKLVTYDAGQELYVVEGESLRRVALLADRGCWVRCNSLIREVLFAELTEAQGVQARELTLEEVAMILIQLEGVGPDESYTVGTVKMHTTIKTRVLWNEQI